MSDRALPTVYLNASGHGQPAPEVYQRMIRHIQLEAEHGVHSALDSVAEELSRVKKSAAALIGADTNAVGLANGTLATWLQVVLRLSLKGNRVLVAPHEWGENIRALTAFSREAGFIIEPLPQLDLADPDLASWTQRIDEDVAAIFVPMVSSAAGYRYPLEAIGQLPRP